MTALAIPPVLLAPAPKVEVREEKPVPTTFRLKITLHNGTVKLTGAMGDLEFTDRLAKQCQQDPAVKTAEAVPM